MFTSWTPGLGGPLQELAGEYAHLERLKTKLDAFRPLSPEAAGTCGQTWFCAIPIIPTPLRAMP
jgi:hypothetical protein